MLVRFSRTWLTYYDRLEARWHSLQASKMTSNVVVLAFVVGVGITGLAQYGLLTFAVGRFYAIELAFSVLLVTEIIGLLFILSHSVADSMGKQFEIVSLILLRNSFKDMGQLPLEAPWDATTLLALLPILTDAVGAVAVFLIIGLFYRAQRHTQITSSAEEQLNFVMLKKFVAATMLLTFAFIEAYSFVDFLRTGRYHELFHLYYTILIFVDILILIISLRYSNLYVHLFRYSSFALATVIIRLSLTAPKYYNVLLSVAAGLFVLLVANVYNLLSRAATRPPDA